MFSWNFFFSRKTFGITLSEINRKHSLIIRSIYNIFRTLTINATSLSSKWLFCVYFVLFLERYGVVGLRVRFVLSGSSVERYHNVSSRPDLISMTRVTATTQLHYNRQITLPHASNDRNKIEYERVNVQKGE